MSSEKSIQPLHDGAPKVESTGRVMVATMETTGKAEVLRNSSSTAPGHFGTDISTETNNDTENTATFTSNDTVGGSPLVTRTKAARTIEESSTMMRKGSKNRPSDLPFPSVTSKTAKSNDSTSDHDGIVFSSNLSLRDLYADSETSTPNNDTFDSAHRHDQHGTLEDTFSSSAKVMLSTPPTSLNVTPTSTFVKQPSDSPQSIFLSPPAVATSSTNSPLHAPTSTALPDVGSQASTSTAGSIRDAPVLYSAIGSLEDPNSSSFKGWKNNRRLQTNKFEFPSTRLLAPGSARTPPKKKEMITETTKAVRQQRASGAPSSSTAGGNATGDTRQPFGLRPTTNKSSDLPTHPDGGVPKKLTIATPPDHNMNRQRRRRPKKKTTVEMFRPSSDAYTPRMGKRAIKYKPAADRTPVQQMSTSLGTLSRPNFRDALRRVAMILHQHIVKIELRFEHDHDQARSKDGLFSKIMELEFAEEQFLVPRYRCTMVRVPMARSGMVCGLKRIREKYDIPSEAEIYEFAHRLFKSVQLSSECSIVCLIYIERLMENAKVPLLSTTWRPIFMCGLLMASKVWQDLSSWNIEFASVYPQYTLESINSLELQFLRMIKWDLYISSSQYAKYYFALRSLVEKPDFRQRYNRMVGGIDSAQASQARAIEQRSTLIKEEVISQLSRSM